MAESMIVAPTTLDRLGEALRTADYRLDEVIAAIGEPAHAALGRNQTVPAQRALAGRDDPLATLIRLWPLQSQVSRAAFDRALPELFGPLADAGLVTEVAGRVVALVDLRPYAGDDGTDGWVVSDLTPGLDGAAPVLAPDYVLGVSPASTSLAQLAVREPVARALDLGTGCGVQSLHLSRHADQVVATDVNTRALAMTRLTAAINDLDLDVRHGSLYQPVVEETFDLIITNPPYVMAPPGDPESRLSYREAGLSGDDLVRRVVVDGTQRLAPRGTLQVLANWAHLAGQNWTDRLTGWLAPTGCDAHVVQREVLDVDHYTEVWLTDAGLAGTDAYVPTFQRWLDYFAELGIEAVGMGWLTVTNAGRRSPEITVEDWPHAIEQPIGPAVAQRRRAIDLDRDLGDDALLARCWRLADDVGEERYGDPGAADPDAIVLRQQRGFRRAERVDTATAAVLGACDGELSLTQLITAVATLLDLDAADLRTDLTPRIRRLIIDGFLQLGVPPRVVVPFTQ